MDENGNVGIGVKEPIDKLTVNGSIRIETSGGKISWVDANQYISGTNDSITIETDDTLTVNCDTSATFNAPTSIFTHTANADVTIKSTNTNN